METAFKVFWSIILLGSAALTWADYGMEKPTSIFVAILISLASIDWTVDKWRNHD